MLRLTGVRVVIALAALALVAGCTATGKGTATPVSGVFAPTGAPVTLTQIQHATGKELPLRGGLSIVMPVGSVAEQVTPKVPKTDFILYRMPDAATAGFPMVQVSWGVAPQTGAVESSWAQAGMMGVNKSVSNYVRSSATWPGAKVAVVATWTEEVAKDSGPVQTDALALWVETSSGTVAMVLAGAPKGHLDGSTALNALRSLTIG